MAGVDSLLKMLTEHDADELRLGTDGAPRIFKRGAPVRVTIPPTSNDILRLLLGPLLTENEATLKGVGKVDALHTSGAGETFAVTLQNRAGATNGAFDVTFRRRGSAPVAKPVAAPVAVARPVVVSSTPSDLASLLRRAVTARASDLHLYTGEPPSLRVDGSLRVLDDASEVDVESLIDGTLDDRAKQALHEGRSVDHAIELDVGRFRMNVYRAAGRLAAAIRVLPRGAPTLAELHLPVALDEIVASPHGLVVVCGPTGSGKSATLAALAQAALVDSARRGRARMLVSLEDPVEYSIVGGLVRQRQIGRDVRDFPTGLRDALREDPDILLIGEMRDPETISLAMTAAETGHLVLTSLHSRSAASSVERIVDSYPAARQQQIRVQLADALRAVIAQRLVPNARGSGRLPAVEILRASANVASLIREGKTAQIPTAIQSGRKEGMLPLERALADMVRAGQIDREDAIVAANDVATLTSYLAG